MNLTVPAIRKVAPNAPDVIVNQIINDLPKWAPAFDLGNDEEVLQFLAQMIHESQGLTHFEESLYYSTPERIAQVWPSRFSVASARPYARNPQALANVVYANRMGNGNAASGDGWKYRGRGGLQATGKAMFQQISTLLKYDFVANPDALADPKWVLPGSLAVAKILKLGLIHDFVADTKKLNGGTIGLADRMAILKALRDATK